MRSEEVENGLEISPWASKQHRKRREESRRRLGSVLGASRGDSGGPWGTQDGVLEAPNAKVLNYRRDALGLSELNLDEVLPGFNTPCTPVKQGAADPSSLRENRRAARYLGKCVVEKRQ